MMRARNEKLEARAQRIVEQLPTGVKIGRGRSQVGGGTLPQASIPSVVLELPAKIAEPLRRGTPPVIGYVERDRLKLDLRTIFPSEDEALVHALQAALAL